MTPLSSKDKHFGSPQTAASATNTGTTQMSTAVRSDGTCPDGTRASGTAISGTAVAFRFLIKMFAFTTTCFILGVIAVLGLLLPLITYFGGSDTADAMKGFGALATAAVYANAAPFFTFVMGIVWAFVLPLLLGYGITRRQFALAYLASGAILSTALTLLVLIIWAISGSWPSEYVPSFVSKSFLLSACSFHAPTPCSNKLSASVPPTLYGF